MCGASFAMNHISDQSNQAMLPSSIQDIADVLGMTVALKLVYHFGGLELSIPKYPADDHPVMVALGKDDGKALCSLISGGIFYVPHMKVRKSVRRDVLSLQNNGKNRREIARLLGISQRHVRRMANKKSINNYQTDLFED